MEEAMLESALHGHAFGLGYELSVLSTTAGLDEGAPAFVLNDELVAKDLRDLTLHCDLAPVFHGGDRRGRQHDQGRVSRLQGRGRDPAARTERTEKHSGEGDPPSSEPKESRPSLRLGLREAASGRLESRHVDKTSLLEREPVYACALKPSLNLSVQVELSSRS
jgi:hypothetical protein